MNRIKLAPLLLACLYLNPVEAVVKIHESTVENIHVTKWHGGITAPGYKQIKDLTVHIQEFEQVGDDTGDAKVLQALRENDNRLKLRLHNSASGGVANPVEYDYLNSHRGWFTDKVKTNLNMTGELEWGYLEWGMAAYEKGVVLHAPAFESKKGTMQIRDRRRTVGHMINKALY